MGVCRNHLALNQGLCAVGLDERREDDVTKTIHDPCLGRTRGEGDSFIVDRAERKRPSTDWHAALAHVEAPPVGEAEAREGPYLLWCLGAKDRI